MTLWSYDKYKSVGIDQCISIQPQLHPVFLFEIEPKFRLSTFHP